MTAEAVSPSWRICSRGCPATGPQVRGAALAAGCVVPQVQVDQVQPAELADADPAVGEPVDDQPVPGGVHHLLLPRPVPEHLRMPAVCPFDASGFVGSDDFTCPRNERRLSTRDGSRD